MGAPNETQGSVGRRVYLQDYKLWREEGVSKGELGIAGVGRDKLEGDKNKPDSPKSNHKH